jgi:hypothetical protein
VKVNVPPAQLPPVQPFAVIVTVTGAGPSGSVVAGVYVYAASSVAVVGPVVVNAGASLTAVDRHVRVLVGAVSPARRRSAACTSRRQGEWGPPG